ncbi:MAG: hypothetical protein V1846_00090 [Candidatus Komeilibacteria bacterium]
MFGLVTDELRLLKKLNTPAKIQDYLDSLPVNFELKEETCYSPRMVMKLNTAHCMEGAMIAALALRVNGYPPLIMDLKSIAGEDDDHVVTLYKMYNRWGGITKTNHGVLRYREPIYRDIRELAASFFHEYFLDSGRKTLRSYSIPLDLSRFDKKGWITAEEHIWYVPETLDRIKHIPLVPKKHLRYLRLADPIEIAVGKITEWNKDGSRNFTNRRK